MIEVLPLLFFIVILARVIFESCRFADEIMKSEHRRLMQYKDHLNQRIIELDDVLKVLNVSE